MPNSQFYSEPDVGAARPPGRRVPMPNFILSGVEGFILSGVEGFILSLS